MWLMITEQLKIIIFDLVKTDLPMQFWKQATLVSWLVSFTLGYPVHFNLLRTYRNNETIAVR